MFSLRCPAIAAAVVAAMAAPRAAVERLI